MVDSGGQPAKKSRSTLSKDEEGTVAGGHGHNTSKSEAPPSEEEDIHEEEDEERYEELDESREEESMEIQPTQGGQSTAQKDAERKRRPAKSRADARPSNGKGRLGNVDKSCNVHSVVFTIVSTFHSKTGQPI